MKKLLIIPILAALALAGCKKKNDISSKLVTASYPTITAYDTSYHGTDLSHFYAGIDLSIQVFIYSFPVGQAPALTVSAYDSVTGVVPVDTVFNGHLNPNKPGLYIYQFSATSKNGYPTLAEYVIAVTNYSGPDLSDNYTAVRGTDTTTAQIAQMANGVYMNTDIAPGEGAWGFFVQTDSVTIMVPTQPTNYNYQQQPLGFIGTVAGANGSVSLAGATPAIQYTLVSDTLGLNNQIATFYGQ